MSLLKMPSSCPGFLAVFVGLALVEAQETSIESPGETRQNNLVTRSFPVPLNFLELLEKQAARPDPSGISDPFATESVSSNSLGFVERYGLVFGPGCTAIFSPEEGTFTVKNTAEQVELVRRMIADLPKQTEEQQKQFVSSIVTGPEVSTELEIAPEIEVIKKRL